MFIKGRFKFMRKHDCDFWNLTYYRVAENKFFKYYKFSLINKVKNFTRESKITFRPRKNVKISSLHGCRRVMRYFNPFLNAFDGNFLNLRKNINFFKIFLKRRLRYVTYIFKKGFYLKHAFYKDILLGVKTPYMIYKPLRENKLRRIKRYLKQITLFYNNFDNIKLKRFGRLGRKGQFGGINYFFLLLESRIDSIVLRLNIGCKFLIRSLIRERKVLVDDEPISYFNFIVKKNQFISFVEALRKGLFKSLLNKIPLKMFFVQPPFYLEINYRTLIIIIVPKLMDPAFVPYPFLKTQSRLISGLHTVLWGW
jgi:hypothetical protein